MGAPNDETADRPSTPVTASSDEATSPVGPVSATGGPAPGSPAPGIPAPHIPAPDRSIRSQPVHPPPSSPVAGPWRYLPRGGRARVISLSAALAVVVLVLGLGKRKALAPRRTGSAAPDLGQAVDQEKIVVLGVYILPQIGGQS